ncbi:flagellar biosynthetic protein FliO [Pseudomonas sp.]|jgi:flagellar protein FliO/FliZ|uniref:flagellar biosynthetic protein FliO n=1 Tax=Pseudomonas sp. TaxID=306 RepID=UPI00272B161B|nr:flagellar biosynthetic protein FliO [Pseudomonas sp.]
MHRSRYLPAGLLLLMASGAVSAQSAHTGTAQASLLNQVLQLGLGLLLVVGLIVVMGYLMRRVGPLAPQGGQHIRLISALPMGPRDRLLLIDVGGKQILLGASPGRINTLHVFDEPVAEIPQDKLAGGDFAQKLQSFLRREEKP